MSNSKAQLKHPIGLLSAPELILAGYYGSSHYFNNGQDVLLASPVDLNRDVARVQKVDTYGWAYHIVFDSGGACVLLYH